MMFFKKKPALIKVASVAAPKTFLDKVEIVIKTVRKPHTDGRTRRMLRTVEDNRLL